MPSDDDGNPDENGEVDDESVPHDGMDAERVKVPPPPPFNVPPPPSLISQSAPPVRRAPDSRIPTETSAPVVPPQLPSPPPPPPRDSEEQSDYSDEEPGPPPPLPPGRPSVALPPPPTAPRPIPSRQKAETQEPHEVTSHDSEEYEEEPSATSFDFPRFTDTTPNPQGDAGQQDSPETEILADEDGGRAGFPRSLECRINSIPTDPIDPGFIPSRSPSIKAAKPSAEPPKPPREEPVPESLPEEEDEERARKQRLAERMSKLGGIRFGAPPPIGIRPPPKVERQAEEEGKLEPKGDEAEEAEDDQARKQRIAARLAGMGGMRIGMVPGAIPPKPPAPNRKDSASIDWPGQKSPPPPPPPIRAPPPPVQPPPPPAGSDGGNMSEDDVVKVEMEESEGEEVDYHDISEELPPPIPSRTARPPIPGPGHLRKGSADSFTFPSQNTAPSRTVPPAPSEYVMVEEPDSSEQSAPPPPQRASRPPHTRPPPPAPSSDTPDNMTMSQWELPPIPRSSLDMETSVADLSASSWSEGFDTEKTSQEKTAEPSPKERRQSAGQMTADQLMTVWGRVGIQVCEVAVQLFEKSKKKLIGDGTYIGFVNAVLDLVPNASMVEEDASSFGYLIYVQTGSSVTKRASDIMPGDIVVLQDAKLKGHKGIQTYNQTVGEGTPVVAVVGEYEPKKSKLKAYQASQHVGHQVSHPMNPGIHGPYTISLDRRDRQL